MKILLIHSEKDEQSAQQIHPFLEKAKAAVDILPVQPLNSTGGDIRKQFAAFFSTANTANEKDKTSTGALTHLLVITPIAQRWLDFLAGFSYGSSLPLLIFGSQAISAIPVEFSSFCRSLHTEKSLEEYLEAENEAFEKWKNASAVMKARETLLQMGIPVTGESLAACAGEGSKQEVSLFLAAGFSPDTRNKAGVPLLNIAARNGNFEILKLLIESGAQVNMQADDRGTSALIDSAMNKNIDMVNALIAAGASLDIKSKDGQTSLVVAVGIGDEKVVEALLKAGANPDVPDSMGVTARKYASLFRKKEIIEIFETYAAQEGSPK